MREEMPSMFADLCEHAGLGKACRECRETFGSAAQIAVENLAQHHADRAVKVGLYTEVGYEEMRAATSAREYGTAHFSKVS